MRAHPISYYSNGKLLLTGEYTVLDGAKALAIPTNYGQGLNVMKNDSGIIKWLSIDELGRVWFETTFTLKANTLVKNISTTLIEKEDELVTNRLIDIFNAITKLRPDFLASIKGVNLIAKLNFNKQWGLGTSSTLINNMAKWADVNPYELLQLTFGGSGYDIACANSNLPITYQLNNDIPEIETVEFRPDFAKQLYFVYLNQKQNSRSGIAQYKALNKVSSRIIETISQITTALIATDSLEIFENLIDEHEQIISKLIEQPPIKQELFSDFKGSIKSLGAWGGDFVLVTSKENPKSYFSKKGFETVVPYPTMIKR